MRKLILFMHTSLDGFVAGPKGEMDWILVGEEMFDYAAQQTHEADTALYGRVTYQIMQSYWPTAADKPGASKHDKEHSSWYNKVEKVVISKTMKGENLPNTNIISNNIPSEINTIKNSSGKNIVMFGSPTVAHVLMSKNLIDDYWLFVNPILLGEGIPLFKDIKERTKLKFVASEPFSSGVVCLHYKK
ncbi:MAG: dihydrofolate reductase family protein [Ginsengibacter sp.]